MLSNAVENTIWLFQAYYVLSLFECVSGKVGSSSLKLTALQNGIVEAKASVCQDRVSSGLTRGSRGSGY